MTGIHLPFSFGWNEIRPSTWTHWYGLDALDRARGDDADFEVDLVGDATGHVHAEQGELEVAAGVSGTN